MSNYYLVVLFESENGLPDDIECLVDAHENGEVLPTPTAIVYDYDDARELVRSLKGAIGWEYAIIRRLLDATTSEAVGCLSFAADDAVIHNRIRNKLEANQ